MFFWKLRNELDDLKKRYTKLQTAYIAELVVLTCYQALVEIPQEYITSVAAMVDKRISGHTEMSASKLAKITEECAREYLKGTTVTASDLHVKTESSANTSLSAAAKKSLS